MIARMDESRCFLGDLLREPNHGGGCFSQLDPFATFAGLHSTPEFDGQITPRLGVTEARRTT